MDQKGKQEPEESEEWSNRANNDSLLAADSTVNPATADNIQKY
jgi:hypothetical protein